MSNLDFSTIAIYAVLIFICLLVISTDKRILKSVKKKAEEKAEKENIIIKLIRNVDAKDGKNPFTDTTFWVGPSSKFLEMSGEWAHYKIVIFDSPKGEQKFWIKIKTVFFMPLSITWKEV